ncbi:NADH dehydrogenase (ubiquinone) Fe-S protein 5 [Exophiala aquamarina CBS 119918]|uniref:NADH dehydrogenase [ubiquinone] iron-sulfur protein 5 n=1 Tax=Exophiala aquamarina CBS 119918 TaxID=1182545 RepID=A0A072PFV4_9EURO|nr:NADH dehydrogenase (ubiquinone) Fe-S protein 5 [Exophiala aquamarina CBS 119918]KEF58726.1 NADH dehydrogenase (ubiquinone) Fe-S protein 5 [Exophiala aquamarina CBS 119918]
MASGYGANSGVSRCFSFWQEYMACYVINQNDQVARQQGVCLPRLEDYYECLHHKKEYARALAMQDALRKAEAAHPRENAPKIDQIRSLGLIGKEAETKTILGL